jgi:hypothetical protein
MSGKEQIELGCPQCSTSQQTTLWKILDGAADPAEKQNLLAGQINFFICKNCGYQSYLSCSFLYHDMANQVVALCIPFDFLDDAEFLAGNFTPEGKTKIDLSFLKNPAGTDGPDPHIVFTMIELVEYVHFRERLSEINRETI